MADDIIITTVAPRLIEREQQTEATKFFRERPEPIEVPREPITLSLWDKIRLGPMLLPSLFIITKGLLMKDLKTTISGIVKAIFLILSVFGISTGNLTEALVSAVLWGIAEIYQSIWTPDKKD